MNKTRENGGGGGGDDNGGAAGFAQHQHPGHGSGEHAEARIPICASAKQHELGAQAHRLRPVVSQLLRRPKARARDVGLKQAQDPCGLRPGLCVRGLPHELSDCTQELPGLLAQPVLHVDHHGLNGDTKERHGTVSVYYNTEL